MRANHLEYERPVEGTGEVRIRVWVSKLGNSSLTFGFRVMPLDQDVDFANGERVIVRIDPDSKRPVAWTDEFREKVGPYRADLNPVPE